MLVIRLYKEKHNSTPIELLALEVYVHYQTGHIAV
jgi:hypothetical protein